MRLIDANKAIEIANEYMWSHDVDEVKFILGKCPAIDAVPVVRCKDCRFWEHDFDIVGNCTYARINLDHAEYGFCSYGERKNDGQQSDS